VAEIVDFCGRRVDKNFSDSLAMRLCLLQSSGLQTKTSLAQLLRDYSATKCQDVRDKVFALVSLSTVARQSFTVDYTYDQAELLFATVEFCSSQEQEPRTICFALSLAQALGLQPEKLDLKNGRKYRIAAPLVVRSSLYQRGEAIASIIRPDLYNMVESRRELCGIMFHYPNLPRLRFDSTDNAFRILSTFEQDDRLYYQQRAQSVIEVSVRDPFAFV
jgi:hypothetical protein